MVTKTFEEIRMFNIAATGFLNRSKKNQLTKLGYAIKRISEKSLKGVTDQYQAALSDMYYETVETVHIDNALTDADGAIRTAPQGSLRPYLFSKEGLKKVIVAEKKFNTEGQANLIKEWDPKEFEIEPYFAKEIPSDLTEDEREAFVGFVIDPSAETPLETPAKKEDEVEVEA